MDKYFSEFELSKFFSAIPTRRKKVICQSMLELGCRVGELCSLKVKWIHRDYIKIFDEKADRFRSCVVSPDLTEEILSWYIPNRKVKRPGPALFLYEIPRTLRNWVKEIGKWAGIPREKLHPHTFRHTFVRLALSRGWNIRSICQQTGHTPETMLKVYSDLSIDDRIRQIQDKPLILAEKSYQQTGGS